MKKKLSFPTDDTASFGEVINQQLDNIEAKMPKIEENKNGEAAAKEIKDKLAAKITGNEEDFSNEVEKRLEAKKAKK
jgi:hypothetical protein